MQILERSFGRQDVFYYLVQSCPIIFFFFLSRGLFFFPPRWLAKIARGSQWVSKDIAALSLSLSLCTEGVHTAENELPKVVKCSISTSI